MFLRRLTSRQAVLAALLPVVSLTILSVATGCNSKTPEPKATAVSFEKAQVRLEALVPLHPLTPELARMEETLRRLERLAKAEGVKKPSPVATKRPLKDLVPVTAQILQKEEERVRKAYRTFRATAETGLAEFDFERNRRRDVREVQRRAVLEAILFGELAERETLMRLGYEDGVAAQLAEGVLTPEDALTPEAMSMVQGVFTAVPMFTPTGAFTEKLRRQLTYTNLIAKRDALTNDITSPGLSPPLLPPLQDEQELRAELERLMEDPQATDVSDRARLTRKLNLVESLIEILLAKERQLEAQAARDLAAALRELRRSANEKIEQQLAAERNEADDDSRLEEQQVALGEMLTFDAEVREALSKASNEMPTGGDLPVPSLFGAGQREPNQVTTVSVAAQVARLRIVRNRLSALIRQDVAEAVRDAAQARSIEVQIVGEDSKAGVKGIVRKDQTESFKSWIRPMFQTRRGGGRT